MPPLTGHIVSWSPADALGKIEISPGDLLGFGRSACDFDPAAGVHVLVHAVSETPRGKRATRVTLASIAEHDALLGQRDYAARYAPFSDPQLQEHLEDVRAVGLFSCVLPTPIRSRADLRALFDRAQVPLDLTLATGPATPIGPGAPFHVWIANISLGLRRVLDDGPTISVEGESLVTFAARGPSLRTQRAEVFAHSQLDPAARFDAWSQWRVGPLADAASRLALSAGATAILAAQAGLEAFTPRYFRHILGDPTRQGWRPLSPFMALRFDEARAITQSIGLTALALPDVSARAPDLDETFAIQAVLAVASAMLHRGRPLPAGLDVYTRPGVFTGGFGPDWNLLQPFEGAIHWRVAESTADLVTLALAP